MGYTHYFAYDPNAEAFTDAWPQMVDDARAITSYVQKDLGIRLAGGDGTGKPELTERWICLNGGARLPARTRCGRCRAELVRADRDANHDAPLRHQRGAAERPAAHTAHPLKEPTMSQRRPRIHTLAKLIIARFANLVLDGVGSTRHRGDRTARRAATRSPPQRARTAQPQGTRRDAARLRRLRLRPRRRPRRNAPGRRPEGAFALRSTHGQGGDALTQAAAAIHRASTLAQPQASELLWERSRTLAHSMARLCSRDDRPEGRH
jgi:hypothetical protein